MQHPWGAAQIALLRDGRLHLHHGPIDLVVGATGERGEIQRAYRAAAKRFEAILLELVAELVALRAPMGHSAPFDATISSPVGLRMVRACAPLAAEFITPMAAVAGAVADEIRDVIVAEAPGIRTVHVNNGGDIALHAAPGETVRVGVVPDLMQMVPDDVLVVPAGPIRGVATSGWRGRSFSLGIADAVTVLAASAASADAAATLIANAVNVEDPLVIRQPARRLDPDSDLGEHLVTVSVGALDDASIARALDGGTVKAEALLSAGLIDGALLALSGQRRAVMGEPLAQAATGHSATVLSSRAIS